MKKILTSFMNLSTGEGSRIAYTYSEVDENTGSIISQNNKGNFLVMNDDVQKNLDSVKDYIKNNFLSQTKTEHSTQKAEV